MKYSKYNVVIIGSGMSGLYLANKLAESAKFTDGILLITKENLFSGSSALAQGGIVSVMSEINKLDSIQSHVRDTIKAGCGLNNINTVTFVSENSADVARELMKFGVAFDKNNKNALNFTLEGAHTYPRILHAEGDSTGRVIEQTLCDCLKKAKNIDIYDNTMALELLIDNLNTCKGVVVYNSNNQCFEAIYANSIVIATGGIGQLYKNTTNPAVSTADGIAMAYRAGAKVENMEFVQFHPTALYCKNKKSLPLVSESARGEGAKLVNLNGDYFAKKYHKLADLAPRDVVARAITSQMLENNTEYVNLDISQIGIEKFRNRFPTITSLCFENNIDLTTGLIPVAPAQHYFMGGIKVNLNSMTSVKNLYAIGECASTGLHGANRLASNSLLECGVFAKKLSKTLTENISCPPKKFDEKIKNITDKYISMDNFSDEQDEYIEILFNELKTTMTKNVGIVRSEKSLNSALETIAGIEFRLKSSDESVSKLKMELLNAIEVSKLIISSAIKRKESVGAHYRADFADITSETDKRKTDNDKLLAK